jgi:hypothetical protein
VFCSKHLIVRKRVSNCFDCETRRIELERTGVLDADEERIVRLLCRDLANTIGPGHDALVEEAAARIRLFTDDPADFEQRVVDDVQQAMHDDFIDTSWPRCPVHPQHPLWYSAPSWVCDRTETAFAELRALMYGPNKQTG